MKLSQEQKEDIILLHLEGDMMGGPEATQIMEEVQNFLDRQIMKVVIDLGKVARMNSSGLGILINALTTFKQNGGVLKLANPTPVVNKLLTLSRLTTIFECYNSVDEALSSF
ncbi:MAG: anti-sigma factor antagonist [Calditrichaeota bacterium]|nr:MAG: anti-sigma factor antagonist [Calditrichota bacterium]